MPRLPAAEIARRQAAHRHYLAVRAMHRVASADEDLAASLHRLGQEVRLAALEKQETPGIAVPGGLYRSQPSGPRNARAASAHPDTNH